MAMCDGYMSWIYFLAIFDVDIIYHACVPRLYLMAEINPFLCGSPDKLSFIASLPNDVPFWFPFDAHPMYALSNTVLGTLILTKYVTHPI